MTWTLYRWSRTTGRLAGALLAAAALLAGAAGHGAPVKAAECLLLQVTSVMGPPQLATGATGAYEVTVQNPNRVDPYYPNDRGCDQGMQVLITTGGSLRPTGTIDGGPGVACTAEPADGGTTGGYRCFAASLKYDATATLTASVAATGVGQGRIVAGINILGEDQAASQKSLAVAVTTGPPVRAGATGEDATTIQYLLRHHGGDLEIDGAFGPQTDQAVRDFQKNKGLAVDGVVGTRTWAALFVTVRQGDQGDAVRAVQSQLASRGGDVEVDGEFGSQTAGAVREFQQSKGLTADGVVGPRTWAALVAPD